MPSAQSDRTRDVLDLLATALLALYVATFAVRNVALQWDFRAYLAAARAAAAGLDPYVHGNLVAASGRLSPLPFLYPPVALLPFLVLAALPVGAAAACWIGLKVVLLVALVALWWRVFLPGTAVLPLALAAVLGWNAAALYDLRTGNVALLECALVWAGFACFVAGRRGWFATFVVIAACFKLVPAAWLLLLLVPAGRLRPEPRVFALAVLALVVLVCGPLVLGPAAHWNGFLRGIPPADDLGDSNPSALGLAGVITRTAHLPAPAAHVVWIGFVIALALASLRFLRDAWRRADPARWVMASVFLVVLMEPRPMAYGYACLAPAPLWFAPRPFGSRIGRLGLALLLSVQGIARAFDQQPAGTVVAYAPFLLTLGVWLLVITQDRSPLGPRAVR